MAEMDNVERYSFEMIVRLQLDKPVRFEVETGHFHQNGANNPLTHASGQHPHHTETGQLPYLGSRDNDSNKISIGDKRCQMIQRHSTRTFLPTPRKQNFRRHRQVGQYAVPQFCRLTEYTCQ